MPGVHALAGQAGELYPPPLIIAHFAKVARREAQPPAGDECGRHLAARLDAGGNNPHLAAERWIIRDKVKDVGGVQPDADHVHT